jgi:azurin
MRLGLALATVVGLVLIGADAPVTACDCITTQPLSAAVRTETPFIFEGKAIEVVERSLHTLRTTSGGGSSETTPMGRQVVFEVTRTWNGVTTKKLTVAADVSDCMFPFKIDETYVVFAWKGAKGGPSTSICTRTVESSKGAAVLAALGPGSSIK